MDKPNRETNKYRQGLLSDWSWMGLKCKSYFFRVSCENMDRQTKNSQDRLNKQTDKLTVKSGLFKVNIDKRTTLQGYSVKIQTAIQSWVSTDRETNATKSLVLNGWINQKTKSTDRQTRVNKHMWTNKHM